MKILYIVFGVIFLVFLTLYFWLTPDYLILKVNESQDIVSVKVKEGNGGFITDYKFKGLQIERGGKTLLSLDEGKLGFSFPDLLLGRVRINIYSNKIKGFFYLSFLGNIKSELDFKDILFDTELINLPPDISFSGLIEGRLKIDRKNTNIEFNLNNLDWRNFEIEKNRLPYDIFQKARGGVDIAGDKIIIKSFGFEGDRGYARLMGDIEKGKSNLFIEIFPKDFSDPYMLPFYEYKQSSGYYKIPISLKKVD